MTAPLPLFDLGRQHAEVADEAREAFDRLAAAGDFVLGAELEAFEREFAAYCGSAHCVGVSSGTDALRLALSALGAGPGTEVVTPALTFVATVEAIAATGATPVLADVDAATRCIDPAAVASALSPRTTAVVPVHLYGRPAPMPALAAACGSVPLLEDAAQAHGARLDGARAGALGAASAFSFYPTKNLGALGDGGAVTCDDAGLADLVRSLRHHGSVPGEANRHVRAGGTFRLDNLQAAMLRLKLPRLDEWNRQRSAAAHLYRSALEDLPLDLPPGDPPGGEHAHHLFTIEVDQRDVVRADLAGEGVATGVHYPAPVHLQPAWRDLGQGEGSFPAAERCAARTLSLPLFPGITETEVERVAAALTRALARA